VGAYLGAQGPDFGLHEQGAGSVELGQFHLHGHPVRYFARRPDQPSTGLRCEGCNGSHHAVAGPDRSDHGVELSRCGHNHRPPIREHSRGEPHQGSFQFFRCAVPRQDGLGVRDGKGVAAEQGTQLPARLGRSRRVEPGAQVLSRARRRVQCLVRGSLGIRPQLPEGADHLEAYPDDDCHGEHDDGNRGGGDERGIRHGARLANPRAAAFPRETPTPIRRRFRSREGCRSAQQRVRWATARPTDLEVLQPLGE
jgi:hypothetical protein